jgi:hypothetical protein
LIFLAGEVLAELFNADYHGTCFSASSAAFAIRSFG